MRNKLFYINFILSIFWITPAVADINVALIAPQSGNLEMFGKELWEGARIAIEEINSGGGILGEKINLIMVDDRCDNRFAISTAQMIALHGSKKDKINLVIGPYCSNSFSDVANIYAQADIFQIVPTPISAAECSIQHQGLIKMTGYIEQQSQSFYDFSQQNYPNKKIGLVYDSRNRSIMSMATSLQKLFAQDKREAYLSVFDFAAFNDDFEDIAEAMEESHVQIAYILGQDKNSARLVAELKDIDQNIIIFADKYQINKTYQEYLGKAADGTYVFSLPTLKDNPEFTETLVKLRLLGIEPEGLSVYGYSAVRLWEELVKQSDSFDYAKLIKKAANCKIDIGWGETVFTNGIPEQTVGYHIYRIENGEYTQVD